MKYKKQTKPPTLKPLTILVFFLLCLNAFAQEASKKTCRILFLERPANAPAKLQLFDGTTSREVELPGLNFSPVYELPPGMLNLTLLPSPPKDAEKLPYGAPTTRVPENISDFYLIVTSDPKNKVAPVRIKVIDAGQSAFRDGQMLWYNLTDLAIAGKLGTEKIVIKPQSKIIMNAPVNGSEDYPVSLGYRGMENGLFYPICETRWIHNPKSRSLGFLFMQAGSSRTPRVQVFPDFRDQPHDKKTRIQ